MHNTKLTTALLLAGFTMACGAAHAAEAQTAAPDPKPAARPTTLPPASTRQGVTFATDIKPLLDASCVRCHGGQKPKGNLRLDSLAGVLKGSEDGKVLVVGDSAKSKIVASVARINPKTAMPPDPRAPRRGGPGGPGGPARDGVGEGRAGAGAPPPSASGAAQPAGGSEKANDAAKTGEAPARPPGGPGGPGGRNQGPPPKPLTAEEVGLVRAWIDQGAK